MPVRQVTDISCQNIQSLGDFIRYLIWRERVEPGVAHFRQVEPDPLIKQIVQLQIPLAFEACPLRILQRDLRGARFAGHPILLAVPERSLKKPVAADDGVIPYKTRIKLKPVLAALERLHPSN